MGQLFSKIGLYNKALLAVGAQRAASVDSADPNVTSLNDIFDPCLQEVISEHTWSFAIQTVTLQTLTLATNLPVMNDGISTAYGLPADFIEVYLLSQPCQYRIEQLNSPYVTSPTQAMLSNVSTLSGMKYIFNNTDPTTWTPKFYDAVARRLAMEICPKVSKAPGLLDKIYAGYNKALLSAISSDSQGSSQDQSQADEWFIARLAGSGVVTGLPNGNIGFFPDPYNPNF